jgi:photosystem II stability/assembly factor-like uncharacterized protein
MREATHVYAGTAGHSAWFSEDAGESWVHPNSHSGLYLEARVWAFATHPQTPDILFAGTDMGAYRWSEAVARWSKSALPAGDVWAIAQDPRRPQVLLAGTRPAGFWRSQDGGVAWHAVSAPGISLFSEINMGPTRVTQILFDPLQADVVWATVEIGGIYKSVDGGATWMPKYRGLVSADVHGIAVMAMPNGAPRLFATTNKGLHRSDDGGDNWRFVELDSPWQYTRAIVPRADASGVVFLTNGNGPPGSTGRLLRSRDHGAHWEPVALPGALNSTPWCVATHAADPMLIFVCTNLGQLFRSSDGGESFLRLHHEFGELRALHWRPLPPGTRQAEHALTRRVAP